ncbi:MAG: hypothetical protein MJ088_00405 [Clostridia bacterium]|nr:hypothetical protein [Clostridia bacterium]
MKLLRPAALLAAILFVLTAAVACTKSEVPAGMTEASPATGDFHLYVPKTWTVDLETGAVSAYYSKADPSSVNVMVWEVSVTDYTPEEWWESGLTDLESIYTDLTLAASNETLLDGVRAMQYEWTGKIGQNTYRFLQVAAVRRGMVYVFTYGALDTAPEGSEVSRFASHLEDVESMLREFRFS